MRFQLLVLILSVTCSLLATEGPRTSGNRKAGVIDAGILHALLVAPPFLMGYVREGDAETYVFTSPFSISASFDFDVSQSRLYLIGPARTSSEDKRLTLVSYASTTALEAKHTNVTGPNDRNYTQLRTVHALDPAMIFKERVGYDLRNYSDGPYCPAITVDRLGGITLGLFSGSGIRILKRAPVIFENKSTVEPLDGAYVRQGDVALDLPATGLLPAGSTGNWYVISKNLIADSSRPDTKMPIPIDFAVIWDKGANQHRSISSRLGNEFTSISPAQDSLITRYSTLRDRLAVALGAAQAKLGYKEPAPDPLSPLTP